MLVWILVLSFTQLALSHSNPLHAYPGAISLSSMYAQSPKASLLHLSETNSPSHHKQIDTTSYTNAAAYIEALRTHNSPAGNEFKDNSLSYITANSQEINQFPSTITQPFNGQDGSSNGFGSLVGTIVGAVPSPVQTEVIPKPNFVVQPIVETIQKPDFVVQENVIGVIQKPEYLIQEVREVLTRPEYLVQEEVVGTITKPTFIVQDQVIGVVQKPEFAIQEDVEFVAKPDFQIEEVTEIIPKPVFAVQENTVVVQKPTFAVQNSQEVIQKPNIVIVTIPQTIMKPEYQITENNIPVAKPTFFVQETQETVVKPEFVVTEEIVPVPRPNFLVQEEVQVVQKPNFLIQDIVETVQRPEYNVQESTVIVEKPDFLIEEVTETVVKPSFIEQEVPVAVVNPHFVVEEQLVSVPKPQFVVQETVVPVVKPEFNIQDVTEVITKPEYVVEDVAITIDKPTYLIEDTPVIVQKPNYVIEESVETVTKPEYVIQDEVEVITKPQYVVQERVVQTIVKPKFVVVSASNPKGEEFDITKYNLKPSSGGVKTDMAKSTLLVPSTVNSEVKIETVKPNSLAGNSGSVNGNSKQVPTVISDISKLSHLPSKSISSADPHHHTQTVYIHPSIKPQTINEIEEFSHPDSKQVSSQHHQNSPIALGHSVPNFEFVGHPNYSGISSETSHAGIEQIQMPLIHSHHHHRTGNLPLVKKTHGSSSTPKIETHQSQHVEQNRLYTVSLPSTEDKNDIAKNHGHGLLGLTKKFGYQKNSNEFLAPHIKIKKDISKSEEEELLKTLEEIQGLLNNSRNSLESVNLPQDQDKNDSNSNDSIISSDIHSIADKYYGDYTGKSDVDSLEDYY